MKCFYHNDMDGQCAGFWVHLSVGIDDGYSDMPKFIAIDYKDKFPIASIKPNEQIYIVDFSISPEEMRQLLNITSNVTWIDHHKTAIEKYQDFEYPIRGIRIDGISGCELAYAYIHHMTQRGEGDIKPFDETMLADIPLFTKLIGDRDVWNWYFGEQTKYFYAGLQLHNTSPESNIWEEALVNGTKTFEEQGKIVEQFKKMQREYLVKSYSFEVELEGYKGIACNSKDSSELFGNMIEEYDFVSSFIFDGDQYTISLFSQNIDVSEIAKKYGGGGHKGASGFQIGELPFKKLKS